MSLTTIIRRSYNALRLLIMTVLALAVVLPAVVYVGTALPPVQRAVRDVAQTELSRLLGADVAIGDVLLTPFNRVTLKKVSITTAPGDTALTVQRLGAGISLLDLILSSRIVIDYTEIIGLNARLWRDSPGSPLNIQPIIDALAPKDKKDEPTRFDLRVTTVLLRRSAISYDILDAPRREGVFDPSHIAVSSLRADLIIPRISNDDFHVDLRRIAFTESSGLRIDNIICDLQASPTGMTATGLTVNLPQTHLGFRDISLRYRSWDDLRSRWPYIPTRLATTPGSYVNPADFKPLLPLLGRFDTSASFDLDISGSADSLSIERLYVGSEGPQWWLGVEDGYVGHLFSCREKASVDIRHLTAAMNGEDIRLIAETSSPLPHIAQTVLTNAAHIALNGSLSVSRQEGDATLKLSTDMGEISLIADYISTSRGLRLHGIVGTEGFELGTLLSGTTEALGHFGHVSLTAEGNLTIDGGKTTAAEVELKVPSIAYKHHVYTDFAAGMDKRDDKVDLYVSLDNPAVRLMLTGAANLSDTPSLTFDLDTRDVSLASLNLTDRFPDHILSGSGKGTLSGKDINHITGLLRFNGLSFTDPAGNGVQLDHLWLKAIGDRTPSEIMLQSDIADGYLSGDFHWQTLPATLRKLAAGVFPSLLPAPHEDSDHKHDTSQTPPNNIVLHMTVKDTRQLSSIFKLPVEVIYDATVDGVIDETRGIARLSVDAPYLRQKDKLIENTLVDINIDRRLSLALSTDMPTKNGRMALSVNSFGFADHLDTGIGWKIDNTREFSGQLSLSADFTRPDSPDHPASSMPDIDLTLNPGEVVFNDTTWTVAPAKVTVRPERITVSGFNVAHDTQYVTIAGTASPEPSDSVTVRLSDMNLDYIFETLNISNVVFGGNATGTFYASAVLSPSPRLYTPALHVNGLKYNHSLLGNTDIASHWDVPQRAVVLDAVVSQPDGHRSYINGSIMPMADSLDFHFKTDHLEVGFLKPFMAAFAEDVGGYASGDARLWGSFKFIDLVGNLYADSVYLRLGFTGTTYWASDSVRITPGRIDLSNITLTDRYGHTGLLNGYVAHKCFKEPRFEFAISDLRQMLAYDVRENIEHPWYGRIFANGGVNVKGIPGLIDIGINVSTAPNSTFTFVLSDTEQANDYTFITFRDRDRALKDSLRRADPTPEIVRRLRDRIAQMSDNNPSVYRMDFQVDVTPQALVNLIMDPVGGDRISARGNGNLRLTYDSANEDVRMFGTYTLTQGSYNFTLQDIILKDFTIQDGSSIAFQGNPYNAMLDIRAYYALNANLSDLDESFLQDKELNRTNVPVHAIMNVRGDMTQPDIEFDLEFPTLTRDTYRKVRSIVSTEDMMNRQIIYLLALNRFYTPDYMSATRGNELVSVASSTLSSQLSNILGQLSDKVSIAPNVRSDRGDFSDVEVDLALSSHLLNNRLLLNGNFGYRDKSLNTNTFVGDFDVEYLLNRTGTFRLKAYNRYNDQNYYLRSALTTQGVGLEIRRDFDSLTSFLRPVRNWWPWKKTSSPSPSDKAPEVLPHREHATEPSEFKTDLAPARD